MDSTKSGSSSIDMKVVGINTDYPDYVDPYN